MTLSTTAKVENTATCIFCGATLNASGYTEKSGMYSDFNCGERWCEAYGWERKCDSFDTHKLTPKGEKALENSELKAAREENDRLCERTKELKATIETMSAIGRYQKWSLDDKAVIYNEENLNNLKRDAEEYRALITIVRKWRSVTVALHYGEPVFSRREGKYDVICAESPSRLLTIS